MDFSSTDYFNNGLIGNSGGYDFNSVANGNGNMGTFNLGQSSGLGGSGGLNTSSLTSGMSGLQMGQLGLGAASGLLSGYLGLQNLSLAKSQAKQAQANWDKQWNANVSTTNASLSDRQAARVASNPNAYQSVDSYMKKYGIS